MQQSYDGRTNGGDGICELNVYGEKVLKERPWHVTDMGDSYAVTGSLEKGFF